MSKINNICETVLARVSYTQINKKFKALNSKLKKNQSLECYSQQMSSFSEFVGRVTGSENRIGLI